MLGLFYLSVSFLLLMIKMFEGTVVQNHCLNVCVELCGTFDANFVLVQVEMNRTDLQWDSNQRPLGNTEEKIPEDSESDEKSVFELEFSPTNKRKLNCHIYFVLG